MTIAEKLDIISPAKCLACATPLKRTKTTGLEKETCSRCGGSGRYSYCQMYGDTCFKCCGSGTVYTKRGAVAAAFLKTLRSKPAKDFTPGDLLFVEPGPFTKGGFRKVLAVGWDELNAGMWSITLEGFGLGGSPETRYRIGLTAEQKAETMRQALDYQDTLTKQGTVRKMVRKSWSR